MLEITGAEELIISLINVGYYPDYIKIDQGFIPSFNTTLSRLYLRKGSHVIIVPAGYELFAINYYNLKTIAQKISFKVFLSYSRADLRLAHKVQKILTEAGIYVYFAELYPEPGVTLWEKIKGMIHNSDAVIVLWTKNAKNSAFVNQELGYAEALNKLIIPLVEQGVAPEGLLAGREYIPYRRGRDVESFSMLCNAIYKFLLRKMKKKRNNK
jgi:hypothetical protein